jgi:hypothetical protein
MLVGDENVPEGRQRHAGEGKLSRDAIAAIDHVRHVPRDDHLSGCGARPARPRSTACAEENELRRGA